MKSETGEGIASMRRRADDNDWPAVERGLRDGATLFRPTGLDSYYLDFGDGPAGGGSLSPARVRKLEGEGVLEAVGEYRYALAARAAP